MRVERVGEVVGQGICGGDGAGHPAGGYCASMGDDWRVRIAFDEDDLESRQFRGHFHYAAFGVQLSNWRS